MPIPVEIKLLQKARLVEIKFDNEEFFTLPCQYLRVYSPSADIRGHSGTPGILQIEKEEVNIIGIDPVGNYAVKLIFDDGHNTGIYSWDYLYDLGLNHKKYWQEYLDKLAKINSNK